VQGVRGINRASGITSGQSAWLIAAAALVPLLLFLLLQGGYAAREQRRAVEAEAQSRSEALILRADSEVIRLTTVLDALGTSAVLRRGDLQGFGDRIDRFVALHPDIAGVVLRDREGRTAFSYGVDPGTEIRVAQTGPRAGFIGYARSKACRCLLFETGVTDGAGRRFALQMLSRSQTFFKLLPPTSEYDVAALADTDGHFIARSIHHDERFGSLGSTFLREAVHSGSPDGFYRGRTLEGLSNYTAYSRSPLTGWTAHLALGAATIDKQASRYFASLAFAALLSLTLAGFLIVYALRQLREGRLMTERLQQAQKMEALGQLTGGLAHDFNNLLTPVIGTLDQLQRRETLDERGKRLASGALASAKRAARLTQQLLAFSRRQRLMVVPVDIGQLLTNLGELVERTVSTRHPFSVDYDEQVRCVRTDANQLELALLNLIINARDASPEGGAIVLTVAGEGEAWVRFAVTDRGAGMDEETRRRAFEPFFTTKAVGRGTGLGLAQVFGVVEQSGGTVEIDSKAGEGTTVTLRLPACDAAEVAAVAAAVAEPALPLKPARVLVVDDEADVRAVMARILSEAGHAVDSVASGTSALAALGGEPFDLLVTDYLMPGMNGVELIEQAAWLRPELRFLIVTGFADSEVLERAPKGTVLQTKPFTGEELLAAAARALG
jgi:signal transduction histidine kinase/CheY-like chemotaxis protein